MGTEKPLKKIMKMRKQIVAGNWKMNLLADEAEQLFRGLAELELNPAIEVVVFPPALYLNQLIRSNKSNVQIGAQNAYSKEKGAFTGEISMTQLKSIGVTSLLIGHSERRSIFQESHELLKDKVNTALETGLRPFFCCGEPLEIRQANTHLAYVKKQLEESLFHLSAAEFTKTVIAYEPVWAIGTGLTASIDQAEEMHAAIRSWITEKYGAEVATNYSILYGGSCNPSNASALFACSNVDGGLIGGAALSLSDFSQLIAEETWITTN